jgi:hypothetical protein
MEALCLLKYELSLSRLFNNPSDSGSRVAEGIQGTQSLSATPVLNHEAQCLNIQRGHECKQVVEFKLSHPDIYVERQ